MLTLLKSLQESGAAEWKPFKSLLDKTVRGSKQVAILGRLEVRRNDDGNKSSSVKVG